MKYLIRLYEALERKQDNGTITMEEDAMRIEVLQEIEELLYK